MAVDTTLGEGDSAFEEARRGRRPYLFLCLEAERPWAGGERYDLDDVHTVEIGRGDTRSVEAQRDQRGCTLYIRCPDARMSRQHVRLERALGHWVFRDLGARNGVVFDGARAERGAVAAGALFEIGRTFFLFDEVAAPPVDAPRGFPTLLPTLAGDLHRLERIADSEVEVLIQGASGTGKEVVARWVHERSGRGPFVAVNSGSIPDNLVESELFGYRKGAFSGATEDRLGLVRTAEGGTLFLDEIGDLPATSQAAFLRVLQEREVVPVGGTGGVKVDFRLVAASHRDVSELVARGAFRDDLYGRLAGYKVSLPSLRERRADLGLLIAALLRRLAAERAETFSLRLDAARLLMSYDWPQNVRELEKCLTVATVLADEGRIDVSHLPATMSGTAPETRPQPAPSKPVALSSAERERRLQIVALLREHGGNVSAVARAMGKGRTQILRWLERYAIDADEFRS